MVVRRLLPWPEGVGVSYIEPMSGPAVRGSGQNTFLTGDEQTFSTPGDRVSFRLEFPPMQGETARRFRAWKMGLANGANWTRFRVPDGDRAQWSEIGISGQTALWNYQQTWSDGNPWEPHIGIVGVGGARAAGSNTVRLQNNNWANAIAVGWMLGFVPFHFGCYWVTEVLEDREFRIWPNLRSTLPANAAATLQPVLAMAAVPNSASGGRGINSTEGESVALREVINPYVQAAAFF
ncbi:hypothetical protein L1787_13135 [Acuticoccus sp. M5D2P5]|uniref:hypothetical protein n=1 Tax=Acuticoccus kalidii TaxID=2910977 RepID=UPI001F3ABF3D|nr:hypothetical protein [Acuticoccus kalidii]MCF3934352.1 hypothetical protein [Acuticoccus kalidii]